MASKHWLNGHEIAIDRATPKEEPSMLKNMLARMPLTNNQRRSFDNGEQHAGQRWHGAERGEYGMGRAEVAWGGACM